MEYHNRLYALLSSLSDREQKKLLLLSEEELSPKQQLLLKYFSQKVKQQKEPETNEVLLLKIYKQTYSPIKDAALRNDLAETAKFISNYLVQLNIVANSKSKNYDYEFLSALIQRKSFKLFEREIKKSLKEIIKNEDYENFHRFFSLNIYYQVNHATKEENTFNEIYQYVVEHEQFFQKMICNIELSYGIFLKHAATSVRMFDKEFSEAAFNISPAHLAIIETSPLLKLKKLKWHSYQKNITDNIKSNLEILALLPQLELYSTIDFRREEFSAHFNLFTFYSLAGNYSSALEIAEKIMLLFQQNNYTFENLFKASFLLNYITTLYRNFEIDKAITCFFENEEKLNLLPYTNRVEMYRIFTLLFQEKHEEAFSITQKLEQLDGAFDKILIKIIEAIVFYERHQIDLVNNSLVNIQQAINYHNISKETGHKYFVDFFKQILLNASITKISERKKDVAKIKASLDSFLEEKSKGETMYLLPLIWLKFKLQKF